jgi:hypothetical protein
MEVIIEMTYVTNFKYAFLMVLRIELTFMCLFRCT